MRIYIVMYVWRIKHLQSFYMYCIIYQMLAICKGLHSCMRMVYTIGCHLWHCNEVGKCHVCSESPVARICSAWSWWKAVFFPTNLWGWLHITIDSCSGVIWGPYTSYIIYYIRCIQKDSVSNPKKSICIWYRNACESRARATTTYQQHPKTRPVVRNRSLRCEAPGEGGCGRLRSSPLFWGGPKMLIGNILNP